MKTLEQWHQVIRSRDVEALDALLAEDVVFYSPVVFKPQAGKALTTLYLTAALKVLFNGSFHYVREVSSGQEAVLEFEVTIDGILCNGVDIIRWNEQGQIVEFKVMLRPLKAINLIHGKMAEMLETLA